MNDTLSKSITRPISLQQLEAFMCSIVLPDGVQHILCRLWNDHDVQTVLHSEEYCSLLTYDTSIDALHKIHQTLSDDVHGFRMLLIELMACVDNAQREPWCSSFSRYFTPTMKCFSRFIAEYNESYGVYGFDRWWWVNRQINARLLRIGELEYEIDFSNSEIHIHIPSDAKLTKEYLNASLSQANVFFSNYLSWKNPWLFSCESWLLSPALSQLLPPNSRIREFQKYFVLKDYIPDADDYLEWVFKIASGQRQYVQLKTLREDTGLQRNMKRHILSGGNVGVGIGILNQASYFNPDTSIL